jgi:Flp pilus assembly protein TadG
MFTLALPMMMGALGLVVDLGWGYFTQQEARAAAESAALAAAFAANSSSGGAFTCGSQGVVCQAATQCPATIPNPATNDFDIACSYAKDNGFVVTSGGAQNVMVAANTGAPPTVSGLTVPYWVTVTVSQSLPQTFSAVLGHTLSTVSVRATATYTSGTGSCVYVLNPTANQALSVKGAASLQTSCSIFVNSSSSDAVDMVGTSNITTAGGATTNINGNWHGTGNTSISPSPNLGVGTTADPFASLPAPAVGSCTNTGVNVSGSGSSTLDPGVYCGAISLGGSGTVSLNPGVYVLKNGISTSGSVTVSGSGVTLYVLGGGASMAGSGALTLSAQTSGTYQGIVIFQDRSNSSAATFVGSTAMNLTGVLYMPAAAMSYTGTSGADAGNTTIVADTLQMVGTTSLKRGATTQFTPGGTGAALIE